ncbi:MAG: alpha/beta hydrolase [Acidimicrobiia bacterium]|nr:alpha/beta hydrolase [Acidimicrobiia bacterium]
MTAWHPYPATDESTVVGTVLQSDPVPHEGLGRAPVLTLHLPQSHIERDRRYPVLYMHDGQNLFDEVPSYSGEWQVDETLTALAAEGLELIVVGITNGPGEARAHEYTLFPSPELGGGNARVYLDFLVNTVKPLVDVSFLTEPGPSTTGIMGSSLGGLVSLYGFFEHPDVFGRAGAMSPAFHWDDGQTLDYLRDQPSRSGRIYMDVGTIEDPEDPELTRRYHDDFLVARDTLAPTYEDRLMTVIDEGAIHHESAWARRLPDALRHLFG